MSKRDDGGPAFPWVDPVEANDCGIGMSLRDWFAGQALCVLMNDMWRPSNDEEVRHLAVRLYQVADAMLAARAQEQP